MIIIRNTKKVKLLTKLAGILDVPTEVMPSLPRTTVVISSNMCINIGSCEKIVTYDENYIKIQIKYYFIEVSGENLILRSCRDGSLDLEGTINRIEFIHKNSFDFRRKTENDNS